jgi:GNS1/SUR4 family
MFNPFADKNVFSLVSYKLSHDFIVKFTIFLVSIITIYMWFLFSYGPKFMKNREPYKLLNIIRVYNIFQLVACSIFVIQSYLLGFDFRFIWRCESFDFLSVSEKQQIMWGAWWFLGLRMIEFVETVFFILRKKRNQASFLHIYHHISTVILMYIYFVFDTGEFSIRKRKGQLMAQP